MIIAKWKSVKTIYIVPRANNFLPKLSPGVKDTIETQARNFLLKIRINT